MTQPSRQGDGFRAIKGFSSSSGSAGLESSALHAPADFDLVSKEAEATTRATSLWGLRVMAP